MKLILSLPSFQISIMNLKMLEFKSQVRRSTNLLNRSNKSRKRRPQKSCKNTPLSECSDKEHTLKLNSPSTNRPSKDLQSRYTQSISWMTVARRKLFREKSLVWKSWIIHIFASFMTTLRLKRTFISFRNMSVASHSTNTWETKDRSQFLQIKQGSS